jgi:hypothetical protein
MSEHQDKQWLDHQLRQLVNGTTPVFDAESWKQRYRKEYQMLLVRGKRASHPAGATSRIVLVLKGSLGKLAVAAAIIGFVTLFFADRAGREPNPPGTESRPVAQSPARMMSMMSLRMAYQQGGFDALDRQLQDTLDEFGPRSLSVSMQELF